MAIQSISVLTSPTKRISISTKEEIIAQEMVRTRMSGQRVSLSGRTARVKERFGYLLGLASRGRSDRPYKPSPTEIRRQITKATYTPTPLAELRAIKSKPTKRQQALSIKVTAKPKPKIISKPSPAAFRDPRTGKVYGTVTPYKRPKEKTVLKQVSVIPFRQIKRRESLKIGLGELSARLSPRVEQLRNKKILSRTGNMAMGQEAALLGLASLSQVINFGKGIVDLPETAYAIIRDPTILKDVPKNFKKSAEEFGYMARVSPGEAFVRVGTEVVLMKGTGAAISKLSKVSSSALARLNPKYVGKATIGKTLTINTGAGKSVKLKVVGKIPKETLKSQVSRAGKRVSAISSQADDIFTIIKKSRVVRKPIPGEAGFSTATKKLLKQFDEGKISSSNLVTLNKALQKQGAKGLLEISNFDNVPTPIFLTSTYLAVTDLELETP